MYTILIYVQIRDCLTSRGILNTIKFVVTIIFTDVAISDNSYRYTCTTR